MNNAELYNEQGAHINAGVGGNILEEAVHAQVALEFVAFNGDRVDSCREWLWVIWEE